MASTDEGTVAHQSVDRRYKQRFPINRSVRYTILWGKGRSGGAGTGLTSNVSSAGIAFTADRPVPVGTVMEVVMSWPVTLEDGCRLQLVAVARAIRSKGIWVACVIEKFEFRTAPRVPAPPANAVCTK
jgi:hypothetical protein